MDGDLMRIWCLRRSDEKSKQTKEEILFCAKALRRSIVCGEDKIPAEVFKEEGPLQEALIVLVQRIWQEEEVPEELVRGLFVMVYKGKGSSDDMTKYRCICLLNHAYKLLSAVLLRRLVGECEDWLPEHQAGFRKFCGQHRPRQHLHPGSPDRRCPGSRRPGFHRLHRLRGRL